MPFAARIGDMGSGHGLVPNRTPLGCSRNAWPRLQIVQDQAAQLAWLLHRSSPWAANTTSRSQQAAKIRNMMSGSAVRKRTDCLAGRPGRPGAQSRRAVKGRGAMSAASLPCARHGRETRGESPPGARRREPDIEGTRAQSRGWVRRKS